MRRAALPRPRGAALPVAMVGVVVAVWAVVGHDTGLGWVEAVGTFVTGGLVVGLVGPAVATARVRCSVVAAPRDAVAGGPARVEVTVRGAAELKPLDPPGARVLGGGRPTTAIVLWPEHRGVVDHCWVRVASAAPFGLLWWTKTLELPLPRPIAVAPRVGRPDEQLLVARDDMKARPGTAGRGDGPRGVRPYERGDRRALVHWPASAHTGALMVRETEPPAGRAVTVSGVLPGDPDEADRHAERVMGTIAHLLVSGAEVALATVVAGGQTVSVVRSVAEAGRQLALAEPRRARRLHPPRSPRRRAEHSGTAPDRTPAAGIPAAGTPAEVIPPDGTPAAPGGARG